MEHYIGEWQKQNREKSKPMVKRTQYSINLGYRIIVIYLQTVLLLVRMFLDIHLK